MEGVSSLRRPWRRPALLAGCVHVCLLARASGESVCIDPTEKVPPKRPGDKEYCMELKSLDPSEGDMSPHFDEETSDYVLNVTDVHAKSLRVRFGIDTFKYDPQFLPGIRFNGTEFNYSGIDATSLHVNNINLSETDGPYNRTFTLTVYDPKVDGKDTGGGFKLFGGLALRKTKMDYNVLVRQEPVWKRIMLADNITALLPNGTEVTPTGGFDPHNKTLRFDLPHGVTRCQIKGVCNKFVQELQYDDHVRVKLNSQNDKLGQLTDVGAQGGEAQQFFTCIFNDPEWVTTPVRKSYLINMYSETNVLANIKVTVRLIATDGMCEGDETRPAVGFTCRVTAVDPRIFVIADPPDVRLFLEGTKGEHVWFQSGVPQVIDIKAHDWLHVLVTAGHAFKKVKVIFKHAPMCTELHCPLGQVHRESLAKALMCQGDICDHRDIEHCCVDAPPPSMHVGGDMVIKATGDRVKLSKMPDAAGNVEIEFWDGSKQTLRRDEVEIAPPMDRLVLEVMDYIPIRPASNPEGGYDLGFADGTKAENVLVEDMHALIEAVRVSPGKRVKVRFCNRWGIVNSTATRMASEGWDRAFQVRFEDDHTMTGFLPEMQMLPVPTSACSNYTFHGNTCPDTHRLRDYLEDYRCFGTTCTKADMARCCRLAVAAKIRSNGQEGLIRGGPDWNNSYVVDMQNGTRIHIQPADFHLFPMDQQNTKFKESYTKGQRVKVYGVPATIISGPDARGSYVTRFLDGDKSLYTVREFALKRSHLEYAIGEEVEVRGIPAVVKGYEEDSQYKVDIQNVKTGSTETRIVASALVTKPRRYTHYHGPFAPGKEVMVDRIAPAIVMGGPDSHQMYRVAWPGGMRPKDLAVASGAKPRFCCDLVKSERLTRKGFAPGDEVFVDGIAAVVIMGPDEYGRYVVNYADDSTVSEPIKEDKLVIKRTQEDIEQKDGDRAAAWYKHEAQDFPSSEMPAHQMSEGRTVDDGESASTVNVWDRNVKGSPGAISGNPWLLAALGTLSLIALATLVGGYVRNSSGRTHSSGTVILEASDTVSLPSARTDRSAFSPIATEDSERGPLSPLSTPREAANRANDLARATAPRGAAADTRAGVVSRVKGVLTRGRTSRR